MKEIECTRLGLCPAESLRPGTHWQITEQDAQELLSSGLYQPSTGFPIWAMHHRRSLWDGSCLHLVQEGNKWTLHRDRHDPHASPTSLIHHIVNDAPAETAVTLGLVALVAGMLSG